MIHIRDVCDIKSCPADERIVMVHKIRRPVDGAVISGILAPSYGLYVEQKNLLIANNWNRKTFKEIYLPIFLKEIKSSKRAKDELNRLFYADKAGRDIVLACYCASERLCHRSIIAGLLQGAGCNVDCKRDYSTYYKMYQEI